MNSSTTKKATKLWLENISLIQSGRIGLFARTIINLPISIRSISLKEIFILPLVKLYIPYVRKLSQRLNNIGLKKK